MTAFKWLFTWFSGRLATTQNEDSKMPDDLIQSGLPAVAQPSLQSQEAAPSPVLVVDAGAKADAKQSAPAPDVIEKLESILVAIGHELPVFWHEAVALAKKAI